MRQIQLSGAFISSLCSRYRYTHGEHRMLGRSENNTVFSAVLGPSRVQAESNTSYNKIKSNLPFYDNSPLSTNPVCHASVYCCAGVGYNRSFVAAVLSHLVLLTNPMSYHTTFKQVKVY